jgi:molybdate transport system regulatory protein
MGDRVQVRIARTPGTPEITGEVAPRAVDELKLDDGGELWAYSVTVEAVQQLGLAEGSSVIAVIKASDVILATGD